MYQNFQNQTVLESAHIRPASTDFHLFVLNFYNFYLLILVIFPRNFQFLRNDADFMHSIENCVLVLAHHNWWKPKEKPFHCHRTPYCESRCFPRPLPWLQQPRTSCFPLSRLSLCQVQHSTRCLKQSHCSHILFS